MKQDGDTLQKLFQEAMDKRENRMAVITKHIDNTKARLEMLVGEQEELRLAFKLLKPALEILKNTKG